MRAKIILALLLLFGVSASPLHPQASPYSNSVFPSQIFTATGQTGATIQLNGLITPSSTVGSSFASGTITLTGTSLTTVTFSLLGSADNGVTFFPLPLTPVATPGTTAVTAITATASGLYQVSLAGLTHVRFATSGTFTATNVSLILTASPNALTSRTGGGTGSGSVLPSPQFHPGYYPNAGSNAVVQGDSVATTDGAGNWALRSNGGTRDAILNQTNPATLTCDGIFNSLHATAGALVTVNQGYSICDEGVVSSIGYRSPFSVIFNPEFARDTTQQDFRHLGGYYNEFSPGTWNILDNFVNTHPAQQAGSGGLWIFHQTNQFMIGSGKNQQNIGNSGNWDVVTLFADNLINLTRGISTTHNLTAVKGEGDYQAYGNQVIAHGDDPEGSGEGKTIFRNRMIQDGLVFLGPAAQTYTTGATVLGITGYTGIPPYPYDGDYFVDSTQATAPFYITASTGFSGTTPSTVTVSATLTPDNWGLQTADMDTGAVPELYYGATTPVTVTVSGFTSAPTTGVMCVGDHANNEQVIVTNIASYAAGTATFTAGFRFWHNEGAVYSQGPQACHFLDVMVNGLGNFRNVVETLGAKDAHTLMLSAHIFGGWATEPDGIWSTNGFPTGTVFTRDTFGAVTAVFSGDGPGGAGFNGQEITINANSGLPSSFFGSWDCTETDTGDATITFNTITSGSPGSFTSTGPVYTSHLMVEMPAGRLMPGAEEVYTGDPSTFVLNGNVGVEANTMTIAAGDQLESQGGPEVVMDLDHSTIAMITPTSAQSPSIGHIEQVASRPNDGYTHKRILDDTEGGYFQGDGGIHSGMSYETLDGPHYKQFWTINQPIVTQSGGVMNIAACPGMDAPTCSRLHNFGWGLTSIESPLATHAEHYQNWTGNLRWVDSDKASSGLINEQRWTTVDPAGSPGTGWQVEVQDLINGTDSKVELDRYNGAALTDGITGAKVNVLGAAVNMTAGSGSTLVLTPTTLKYGGSNICTVASGCGSGSMVYPGVGIGVSTGSAWGASLAAPSSAIVGLTDTQTLTNKTVDGVSPTTMAFLDATSSVQTQLNAKAPTISPGFTGTPTAPTQTTSTNNTTLATTNYVKNLTGVSVSPTITPGTGVTSVTCAVASCTNLRGTYTVVGGTATTGVIATFVWSATSTAYACRVSQNGSASWYGLSHSVATTTGMTISAANTIASATFAFDYECLP